MWIRRDGFIVPYKARNKIGDKIFPDIVIKSIALLVWGQLLIVRNDNRKRAEFVNAFRQKIKAKRKTAGYLVRIQLVNCPLRGVYLTNQVEPRILIASLPDKRTVKHSKQ